MIAPAQVPKIGLSRAREIPDRVDQVFFEHYLEHSSALAARNDQPIKHCELLGATDFNRLDAERDKHARVRREITLDCENPYPQT